MSKKEEIKFLVSKEEEILVDILVFKFPEKIFFNTWKYHEADQEFHGIRGENGR